MSAHASVPMSGLDAALLQVSAEQFVGEKRKQEEELVDYNNRKMKYDMQVKQAQDKALFADLMVANARQLADTADGAKTDAKSKMSHLKKLAPTPPAHLVKQQRDHEASLRKAMQSEQAPSAEDLEAARPAGAVAPPVGSWWERAVTVGASVSLSGFSASIFARAFGS